MKEIMIHLERCNGCLTCTLACAAAHSASGSITGGMAEGIAPRIQVQTGKGKPVPVMCRHCQEPACVDACMTGAMRRNPITGLVSNEGHEQACVGCWMCVMACPYGAVTQAPGGVRKAIKCDRCPGREVPACVSSCPNNALEFVEVATFADRKQKSFAIAQAG